MTSVSVFTCPGADQQVTAGVPSCMNNAGAWQQVDLAEPFDPSTLDSSDMAGAFAAGFVVLGTGLAIAWGARMVVQAIRDALPR